MLNEIKQTIINGSIRKKINTLQSANPSFYQNLNQNLNLPPTNIFFNCLRPTFSVLHVYTEKVHNYE